MTPNTLPQLNLNAVERLVVYHLDEALITPLAVRPEQLPNLSTVERFETTNPQDIHEAYDAACHGNPSPDPDDIDARWGVLWMASNQEPLLAAYTDRFGVQGTINESGVCFSNQTFLRWLRERFTA